MTMHYRLFFLFLVSGILTTACKKDKEIVPDKTPSVDDSTQAAPVSGMLELIIVPQAGNDPLFMNQEYQSRIDERFMLKTLSFFLSEIALNASSGKEYPLQSENKSGIHLLEFAKPNIDAGYGMQSIALRFRADTGRYSGLNITMGVPREMNNSDPTVAPAPLDSAVIKGLYWGWDSGYIFMLADGTGEDVADNRFHLTFGKRQGAVSYTYGGFGPTRIRIEENKTTRIILTFDFNEVLTNIDGTGYSLASATSAVVHGGSNSLILRNNTTKAFGFKSVEILPQ